MQWYFELQRALTAGFLFDVAGPAERVRVKVNERQSLSEIDLLWVFKNYLFPPSLQNVYVQFGDISLQHIAA